MAEFVAGAWAAEEVVSTTAQVGVAAYMVSKPTMPLKATFAQIASAPDDGTKCAQQLLSAPSNLLTDLSQSLTRPIEPLPHHHLKQSLHLRRSGQQ